MGLIPPGYAQDSLRIATFHTELDRKGPGLLLRDILRGDPQAEAVAAIIAGQTPDIVVLQGIDYDLDLLALSALRDRVSAHGHKMAHVFAAAPNTGVATGLDMDGDGRRGGPRDAQGYGAFSGQGGMAILSRYPIDHENLRDFSTDLWADFAWARLPITKAGPFPSAAAQAQQRLSTTGHWVVPVKVGARHVTLLAFHASPPAFDGPEQRNVLRNHDEILFWLHLLDSGTGHAVKAPFVVIGNANLDPVDGGGLKTAIQRLLADPRIVDPAPRRAPPPATADPHKGDPALDTASWPAPGPGDLRVSYILPSVTLSVSQSGIHWPPADSAAGRQARQASRHRLVWVDLLLP